ncbi:MAG: glycosyltransferase [Actinomycetota bacterium]|nr:glycosyltransferase [Actinomycetota bacterium]
MVPTRNAQRTLAECLQSLRNQTYPCRVVVVDNFSSDATQAIAERWADAILSAGPERSAQRNVGARQFPADIIGFIDADMIVDSDVVKGVVTALSADAGSVIVPERTVGTGFWTAVRAFERSYYNGSDAVEAARFFRWEIFEQTGGFDECLTGPEDWDLSDSARKLAPVARINSIIKHDEGQLGYIEACKKKSYYAEGLRRYVAKHGPDSIQRFKHRAWLSEPRTLLCSYGLGLLTLKAGEAAAIGTTLVVAELRRRFLQRDNRAILRNTPYGASEHCTLGESSPRATSSLQMEIHNKNSDPCP